MFTAHTVAQRQRDRAKVLDWQALLQKAPRHRPFTFTNARSIGLKPGFVPNPRRMSLIVKICGLSTEATLDAAIDAGADMVGLNLFPRSPRYVDVDRARVLADHARGKSDIVALGVDLGDSEIDAIMGQIEPDWLQLHGQEPPERVASVKARTGAKVVKAIGIREASDLTAAAAYAVVADQLLLDAKPPKGADRPGGLGVPFDWYLLEGFTPNVPWLLSGGLNRDNVGEAVMIARPNGVDVSSGVETAPGVKDPDLIRAFIAESGKAGAALKTKKAS